eukprot:554689-Ditylum_brightwellii.AAC.1
MISNLPGVGTVWFYEKGIANILLLSKVAKMLKVNFDSSNGHSFAVHKQDGIARCFKRSSQGIFYSVMNCQET